jgi:hypothetical protein
MAKARFTRAVAVQCNFFYFVSDDVQQPQNDHEAQRHAQQPQDDGHFRSPIRFKFGLNSQLPKKVPAASQRICR